MGEEITDKYEHFNHYHELKEGQEFIDLGTGEFIADKERIPLLKVLNECGLVTRTHCYGHHTGYSFVAILMDEVEVDIRRINGKQELLIKWKRTD